MVASQHGKRKIRNQRIRRVKRDETNEIGFQLDIPGYGPEVYKKNELQSKI